MREATRERKGREKKKRTRKLFNLLVLHKNTTGIGLLSLLIEHLRTSS